MSETSAFLTVEELKARARAEAERLYPEVHIMVDHLSYPVPVRAGDGARPQVALFNCVGHVVPMEGLWLVAPTDILYLDPATGRLLRARKMRPSDLGIGDHEGKTLGRYDMLRAADTTEEYNELLAELDKCYALLLEPFTRGLTSLEPNSKAAAARFALLFWKLCEHPLVPYYQALGKDFFDWLDNVSK